MVVGNILHLFSHSFTSNDVHKMAKMTSNWSSSKIITLTQLQGDDVGSEGKHDLD